jgi:glycosyltransferase involved in cell wall biosynthesis
MLLKTEPQKASLPVSERSNPAISVIIPVYNGAQQLEMNLQAIADSKVAPMEVIVVDDGSTDTSIDVAQRFGAKILSTGGRTGPAHARNLGAKEAKGEILFFIDADVCVHADTIGRVMKAFADDPKLDALIGSYDTAPQATDFLSRYKNLMHCFVHQTARREACTFWSGCGAIRRQIFAEHSGFDEGYRRPAIEDIELGYRLMRAKRKLMLDRDVLVKHLKRWTFWNLIKTDILDRGVPWTELILRDRSMPNDLNLQISQRISVALVFLLFGCALEGAIRWRGYFLTPVLGLLFVILGRYWVEGATQSKSLSVRITLTALVGLFVWLAYVHGMLPMVPPVLLGYALLFLRHRYAYERHRRAKMTGIAYWVYLLLTVIFIITFLPLNPLILTFYLVFIAIVILNNHFYWFLGSKWGRLYALAAVPFHLLYHFYNGISFVVGVIRHTTRMLSGKRHGTPSLARKQ